MTDGRYWDDKSRWFPDGRTIYFVSNRGGSYNVWGRRFDPETGKPSGDAFRATSFEAPGPIVSPVIGDVEMALAADTLVLPTLEASGNIWILENVDRDPVLSPPTLNASESTCRTCHLPRVDDRPAVLTAILRASRRRSKATPSWYEPKPTRRSVRGYG